MAVPHIWKLPLQSGTTNTRRSTNSWTNPLMQSPLSHSWASTAYAGAKACTEYLCMQKSFCLPHWYAYQDWGLHAQACNECWDSHCVFSNALWIVWPSRPVTRIGQERLIICSKIAMQKLDLSNRDKCVVKLDSMNFNDFAPAAVSSTRQCTVLTFYLVGETSVADNWLSSLLSFEAKCPTGANLTVSLIFSASATGMVLLVYLLWSCSPFSQILSWQVLNRTLIWNRHLALYQNGQLRIMDSSSRWGFAMKTETLRRLPKWKVRYREVLSKLAMA